MSIFDLTIFVEYKKMKCKISVANVKIDNFAVFYKMMFVDEQD